MNLRQHRYRAWIVPYAEETLDARRRVELEAWLAHDPVLAAEAEAERRVVARLRAAADSSEGTAGGKNLWPGIQARLTPHRSPVRPLLLVGGLSAAATSLAWAALWGPLHHPVPLAPLPAQTLSADAPPATVEELPLGQPHSHLNRRPRRGGGHAAKYLTSPDTGSGDEAGQTKTPDAARMARLNSPLAAGNGGAVQTAPAGPAGADRFHLATSVRPLGHGDVENTAPLDQGTAPPASEDTPGAGNGAAQGDSAPGPAGDAAEVTAPTILPERLKAQGTAGHHVRRRHSRGARRTNGGTPAADAPNQTAPDPDAATPTAQSPSRPPSAHKPVD